MASGDSLVRVHPSEFFPEASGPTGGDFGLVPDGAVKGISYAPRVSTGAIALVRLPKTAALSTGATVKLLIADDPLNPIASKNVTLGVNFGKLGTTSTYVAPAVAALGTEATTTITMPSTSGQTIEVSIPIVAANMGSAAADTWALLRVRRLGAASTDTGLNGRVILLGATVLDT